MKFESFKDALSYAIKTGEKIRLKRWASYRYIQVVDFEDNVAVFVDDLGEELEPVCSIHEDRDWETYEDREWETYYEPWESESK